MSTAPKTYPGRSARDKSHERVNPWCGSDGVRCHISVYIHSPAAPARQDPVGREATRRGGQEGVLCRSAASHFCCNAEFGRAKRASTCGRHLQHLEQHDFVVVSRRSYRRRHNPSLLLPQHSSTAPPRISVLLPRLPQTQRICKQRILPTTFSGTVWPVAAARHAARHFTGLFVWLFFLNKKPSIINLEDFQKSKTEAALFGANGL